ncbi:MAG: NPCBM/NEW2 domain-containing protein [Candidatus Brocadiaceae bacterium]
MTAEQQRIRLHILVVFTLVVIAFGVTNLLRTCHRERERTDYIRTERRLRDYVQRALREEQEKIEDFARAGRGRLSRDAAALLVQVQRLIEWERPGRRGARGGAASAKFERIRANFERLKAGQPALFPTGESFLRAFYAPVDGSFRPYSVCIPEGYNEEMTYPLIFTLGRSDAPTGASHYGGAISVKPEGQGAACPHALEDNALAILREVRDLYSVAPGRIYLVDRALGTAGGWHLAVHYPHLFAGLASLGSGQGHRPWAWSAREVPVEGTMAELLSFLRAAASPVPFAENLQHSRVVSAQDLRDRAAGERGSHEMVRRLRELRIGVEHLQFPGTNVAGLPDWVQQYALARILGAVPEGPPERFTFKTADLRHNRAWWIRIDRLGDPVRLSSVEAVAEDGRATISTENISALTVLLDEMPQATSEVVVDGARFAVGSRRRLSLAKRQERWGPPLEEVRTKREGVSGPFGDVLRRPFMVVYGTAGDSGRKDGLSRQEAERFASRWRAAHGHRPRMKSDRDVTRRDFSRFSLVLFGGPEANTVTRSIAGGLPVEFEGDAIVLGGRRYEGEDVGLLMCYPNPVHENRMVAVIAGVSPRAIYQAYERFGLRTGCAGCDGYKWFDYAVFDGRSLGPRTCRVVGFFDNAWQVVPRGKSRAGGGAMWRGEPEAIAAVRPQGFPPLESAAESDDREVSLSDVRPIAIRQSCGAVGFDRSFHGGPVSFDGDTYEKGLGVVPPSSLSFRLDGQFRRFTARVGLTAGAGGGRSVPRPVVCEVIGDGRTLQGAAPLLGAGAELRTADISADIEGVQVLTLKVYLPAGPPTGEAEVPLAWAEPTVSR